MLHYNSEFVHVALAHLSLLLSNKCCISQFIYFNEHLSYFQLFFFPYHEQNNLYMFHGAHMQEFLWNLNLGVKLLYPWVFFNFTRFC